MNIFAQSKIGAVLFPLILLFALAIACSSSGSDPQDEYDIRSVSVNSAAHEAVNFCLEDGISASGIRSIKSESHRNAWYIGGKLNGPGLDGAVAIWLKTGDLNERGVTMQVNPMANEFGGCPDGSSTDARTSSADPEARALRSHLR